MFEHKFIDSSTRIEEVARVSGACHVSAFSEIGSMEELTANLIFHETGQHPFIARPAPQSWRKATFQNYIS